jgi:hypothetical protein
MVIMSGIVVINLDIVVFIKIFAYINVYDLNIIIHYKSFCPH